MTQVVSLKKANALVTETITVNETQTEVEKASFEFQAKLHALNCRYQEDRDRLRVEYHARLAEITGE